MKASSLIFLSLRMLGLWRSVFSMIMLKERR